MEIPKIANTKGIFEIFIPGTFLIVNISGIFILLFYPSLKGSLNQETFPLQFIFNPFFGAIIIICFGYLTGIVLRFLRPEMPDNWSKFYHTYLSMKLREKYDHSLIDSEFPYLPWFNILFQKEFYPKKYLDLFQNIWIPGIEIGYKKPYFNFYKLLTIFYDKDSSEEIYLAEAVTRYNVGIFYALLFSIILFISAFAILFLSSYTIFKNYFYHGSSSILIILLILIVLYLFAFKTIVSNFRLIRVKEVEIVIVASLKNYENLQDKGNEE